MLRDEGATARESAGESGTSRATLYRVLEGAGGSGSGAGERGDGLGVRWPATGGEPS